MANKKEEIASNSNLKEIEKEKKLLKSSYEMYENTIRDTVERMKSEINTTTGDRKYSDEEIDERIKLIKEAESDIIERYKNIGGNLTDLKKNKISTTKKKAIKKDILEQISDLDNKTPENSTSTNYFIPSSMQTSSKSTYDVIPLPSKGECYPEKIDKMPVTYLTAYDENIMVSPNLYKENLVIDYILKEKIMSDSIDPMKMLDGDRDAIILYLRAAGYGKDYPITVTDDVTGKEFDTIVDLSELKFKDFNLKGDENGFFDYELPVTKSKIKFRFLNHQDNKNLEKINDMENNAVLKNRFKNYVSELDTLLDRFNDIEAADKVAAREQIKNIKIFANKLDDKEENASFSHVLTNRLELSVVSVDGNTDRKFIRKFINTLNVKDSSSLRKYINKNEPGIDFNITVKKPESLGGGSMKVFLELDQFVFLNVSE